MKLTHQREAVYKLDLHLHSLLSPNGGLKAEQIRQAIKSGDIDCVAITDAGRVDFGRELRYELGDRIIVGQEIMTNEGQLIGLYLEKAIPDGLSPQKTIEYIKEQNGLVYIPHPFEAYRKGIHPEVLEEIVDHIDIIEVCNGRAFLQSRSAQAVVWAKLNHKPGAASSDAHSIRGFGKTYTRVSEIPTRATLLDLLASGTPITNRPGFRALLYPKLHRLRRKLRKY